MVTARLAIGSVSTLALGALLLGSAPYWLHRGTAQAGPWGSISALGFAKPAAVASEDDRAQLLKLAALKSSVPAEQPAAPAAAEPAPTPQPATTVEAAAADPVPAASPPPVVAAVEPAPTDVATAAEIPPQPEADVPAAAPALVNINTASASALDHLPGAGRIGHSIVSHRPYKAVKDLVSKRVLRLSDFQKIQSHISVD